jgi:adenylate kinase
MSQNKHAYIFIGPPGAGKGSLSHLCVQKLGWTQFSTGDLFRKHRAQGTEIGKQIDFAVKSGKLVEDKLVIKVGMEWFLNNYESSKALILDGFPRTLAQADMFLKIIKKDFPELKLWVINFEIPDEELVQRLSSRRVCKNQECQAVYSVRSESLKPLQEGICDKCGELLIQRDDDKEDVIKVRLKIYHQHAQALLDFYNEAGLIIKNIDGSVLLEKVFEKLEKLLEQQ